MNERASLEANRLWPEVDKAPLPKMKSCKVYFRSSYPNQERQQLLQKQEPDIDDLPDLDSVDSTCSIGLGQTYSKHSRSGSVYSLLSNLEVEKFQKASLQKTTTPSSSAATLTTTCSPCTGSSSSILTNNAQTSTNTNAMRNPPSLLSNATTTADQYYITLPSTEALFGNQSSDCVEFVEETIIESENGSPISRDSSKYSHDFPKDSSDSIVKNTTHDQKHVAFLIPQNLENARLAKEQNIQKQSSSKLNDFQALLGSALEKARESQYYRDSYSKTCKPETGKIESKTKMGTKKKNTFPEHDNSTVAISDSFSSSASDSSLDLVQTLASAPNCADSSKPDSVSNSNHSYPEEDNQDDPESEQDEDTPPDDFCRKESTDSFCRKDSVKFAYRAFRKTFQDFVEHQIQQKNKRADSAKQLLASNSDMAKYVHVEPTDESHTITADFLMDQIEGREDLINSLSFSNAELQRVDLRPCANLTNLKFLCLDNNSITEIDLAPLAHCRELEKVWIKNNHLAQIDLTPLSNCEALTSLDLESNKIDHHSIDLRPLAPLKALKTIRLGKNKLSAGLDVQPILFHPCLSLLHVDSSVKLYANKRLSMSTMGDVASAFKSKFLYSKLSLPPMIQADPEIKEKSHDASAISHYNSRQSSPLVLKRPHKRNNSGFHRLLDSDGEIGSFLQPKFEPLTANNNKLRGNSRMEGAALERFMNRNRGVISFHKFGPLCSIFSLPSSAGSLFAYSVAKFLFETGHYDDEQTYDFSGPFEKNIETLFSWSCDADHLRRYYRKYLEGLSHEVRLFKILAHVDSKSGNSVSLRVLEILISNILRSKYKCPELTSWLYEHEKHDQILAEAARALATILAMSLNPSSGRHVMHMRHLVGERLCSMLLSAEVGIFSGGLLQIQPKKFGEMLKQFVPLLDDGRLDISREKFLSYVETKKFLTKGGAESFLKHYGYANRVDLTAFCIYQTVVQAPETLTSQNIFFDILDADIDEKVTPHDIYFHYKEKIESISRLNYEPVEIRTVISMVFDIVQMSKGEVFALDDLDHIQNLALSRSSFFKIEPKSRQIIVEGLLYRSDENMNLVDLKHSMKESSLSTFH